MLYFFFKQKTGYEMRISDWSSDWCSSDLCAVGPQQIGHGSLDVLRRGEAPQRAAPHDRLQLFALEPQSHVGLHIAGRLGVNGDVQDRKSVVQGKSVSARLDLAGPRIIKNKTSVIIINIIINLNTT